MGSGERIGIQWEERDHVEHEDKGVTPWIIRMPASNVNFSL